jgi:rare lipoprotein A
MKYLIFIILLTSCASTKTSYRNLSHRVKSAKKHELKSIKKGTIFYGQVSFYAEKFHGRKTANGEIFNMNDLTCASKTLPFDTRLQITYLKTGKSIIVRVNDRGPYVGNRILDLSRQAAIEIGLFNDGIGKVKVEVL